MIPSGYSRNVISGTLPGGEIFQTGFWCDEAPSDLAATQTQADALATDWNNKSADTGHPASFLATGSTIDKITVYSYLDTSGKATYVAESALTNPTITGAQTLPDQVALVSTLTTGVSGRRNRGRMYWPVNKASLSGGQISGTTALQLATWVANFLTSVNGDLGDQHVVVLSQVGGTSHAVTGVTVDTKFDIQRRRADKIQPSSFQSVAVTHP